MNAKICCFRFFLTATADFVEITTAAEMKKVYVRQKEPAV
jgi:hypothetical protein